jgi:hypothetical protein
LLWVILNRLLWWVTLNCPHCGSEKNVPADSQIISLKVPYSPICACAQRRPLFMIQKHRGKTSAHAPNYENMAGNLNINF